MRILNLGGASKANIGTLGTTPVNYWYTAVIGSAGYLYIHKAGTTQFRLRLVTDDNNDNGAFYEVFQRKLY